jgi:hypothetical protein
METVFKDSTELYREKVSHQSCKKTLQEITQDKRAEKEITLIVASCIINSILLVE